MEKVSVIVPVYNVEKYLDACVNSILTSTYENLEIILVNDGSTDLSLEICKKYEQLEERIIVINQTNRGLSMARNAGLNQATGKYISFIDADDMVRPEFYEIMVRAIEETGTDWSACDYFTAEEKMRDNKDVATAYEIARGLDEQLAVVLVAPEIRGKSWTGLPVWDKLYLKDKINFMFSEGRPIGEDLEFNVKYCQSANTMVLVNMPLYCYRQRDESIMGKYRKKAGTVERISNARLWMNIASETPIKSENLKRYLEGRACYMTCASLQSVFAVKRDKEEKEFVEEAKKFIKLHWYKAWEEKEFSMKIKLAIFACAKCFPMYKIIASRS